MDTLIGKVSDINFVNNDSESSAFSCDLQCKHPTKFNTIKSELAI